MKLPTQLEEEKRGPESFQETAEQWELGYEQRGQTGHVRRQTTASVVALVGDGPGELLDVGVGPGRLLAPLTERSWTVHGIDPAPRMLELAAERLPSGSGRLRLAKAEELPYGDESFDALTAISVLDWTDTRAALREMARVLRPGGRMVIGVRNGRAPDTAWRQAVMFPLARRIKGITRFGGPIPTKRRRPFSLRQTVYLVGSAGLVVERTENVGCAVLPDPLDRLAPSIALRAARRAERSAALRRVLGTQRLLVAAKPQA